MKLAAFLSKDRCIKIQATEKNSAIRELAKQLHELGLIESEDRAYAQVLHRESEENTGIGNSFAIPHFRTESSRELVSIFGISEEGIDYQAIDGKRVHYILLSIFPASMSTKYLYLIGMMARIFADAEKRTLIESKKSPSTVFTQLVKEAESYFNTISDRAKTKTGSDESLSGIPSSELDLLIRLDRLNSTFKEAEKPEVILKKINELKKLIDIRALTYYEKMKKKNDNPFAIVEKNSCSGCNMSIPPANLRQIKERKGIPLCTYCGRFLINL